MNNTYCTTNGRSRPNWWWIAAMSASLAPGSTSSVAGSPVTRTKKKIVNDSTNSDSSE